MEGITLYSIDYYKKSVFKGSYRGMNFRISKDGDEEEKRLRGKDRLYWKRQRRSR